MTKVTPVARCAALLILLAGATTSAQLVQERAQLESLTRRGLESLTHAFRRCSGRPLSWPRASERCSAICGGSSSNVG